MMGTSDHRRTAGHGFTLIELLVVISIVALLVAMLLPALSKARSEARAVECASRMRQVGIAIETYRNDHKGYYPVHYLWGGTYPSWGPTTYRFSLLINPYLNMTHVDQYDIYSTPEENMLMCPDNGWTGYKGVGGWTFIRSYLYAPGSSVAHNYMPQVQFGHGFWASWINYGNGKHDYRPKKFDPVHPSTYMLSSEVAGDTKLGYVTGGISGVQYYHPNTTTNILLSDGHVSRYKKGEYASTGYTYLWGE